MPALGNRGPEPGRRIPAPRHAPAPHVPSPRPRHEAPPPAWQRFPPSEPFKGAQQHAAKRVQQTQRALPKQPTPHLPLLARPTPAQSHEALRLAAAAQRQAVGPHASASRIAAYQRELRQDPRQAAYRAAVAHYARALAAHDAAGEGRTLVAGNQTLSQPLRGPAKRLYGRNADVAKLIGEVSRANRPPSASATAKPLPKPKNLELPLLGVAHVRVPGTAGLSHELAHALATIAPGLAGATPEAKFVKGALGDVKALGELPFLGGYKTAEAAVQAAKGNTAPAQKLASGVAQGVKEGFVGSLVQGDPGAAEKYFRQHPIISLTELAGVGGVAGRTAGAVARGTGLGAKGEGAVAKAIRRDRAAIALDPEAALAKGGFVHERVGSPDLIRALIQQASDKVSRRVVRDEHGKPVTVESGGRKVPVVHAREGRLLNEAERLINRRGNYYSAGNAALQRKVRDIAPRALRHAGKVKGRTAETLVGLAVTGTIRSARTFEEDVKKRIAKIEAKLKDPAANYPDREGVIAAQTQLKDLRAALTDPKIRAQVPALIKAAEGRAHLLNEGDKQLLAEGVYPEHRLERARLGEAAFAHVPNVEHGEYVNKAAVATYKAAKADHKAAVRELRDARDKLHHAKGAKRSAETKGRRVGTDELKARVKAAKDRVRETRDAIPPQPKVKTGIHVGGDYLPNREVEKALIAGGRHPSTVAYLPHRLEAELAGSHFKQLRPGTRPAGSVRERTFAMSERGEQHISESLVKDELANKATTVAKVQGLDRLVGDAGLRSPRYRDAVERARAGERLTRGERKLVANRGEMTWAEAQQLSERLRKEGKGEYVPIRTHAARIDEEATEVARNAQSTAAMETAHRDILSSRLKDDATGARNAVLVPVGLVNRIEQHLKPVNEFVRIGRLLNVPFRYAVLPQPKWLAGNFIEPYLIRLPLSGSGINIPGLLLDRRAGKKMIAVMEASPDKRVRDAAAVYRAMQIEEGLFIGGKQATVRTRSADFEGTPGRVLHVGEGLAKLPVVHQLGQLVLAIPKSLFWVNRRLIENPAQLASFGKSVRHDMQRFTGQWTKTVTLGQQALEDLSKGLANTQTQHRFLREQHELLGQYDAFGPTTRAFIQSYTPFLPWTLASLRFIYWTMPAHHTVAFTALVKAGQAALPEWEEQHAGTPPGDLRFAPITKKGGFVDLARFTPAGISIPLSEQGPQNLVETFLPQAKGALNALEGKDPFGKDLELPEGAKPSGWQRAGIAANDLFEAFVPIISEARRLQEKGGTGYSNSTVFSPKVKPGTESQSAVNRTLNPFRPIYLSSPGAGADSPRVSKAIKRAEEQAESPRVQAAIERAVAAAERAGG